MERITEVLGEHQNAADAGAAIRELAATADARASFILGVLFAAERERIKTTRRGFAKLWRKVSRRRRQRRLAR
jgi:hypothetical protein